MTSVFVVRKGKNFSAFLLMPPPMMNRSGEKSFSISLRNSLSRLAHCFQESFFVRANLLRSALLGFLATNHKVAEFGVREQFAVEENRRADAGAERQQNDDPVAVLARAEANFGDSCRVRVVDHRDRSADMPGKSSPALVPIHERSTLAAV